MCHLPGEHMAPGCTMERRQAGGSSVMLWAIFCWETLDPAIHVDVTFSGATYVSIVADHLWPFMEMVFPDGSGIYQQNNSPCYKAKMIQELFEEHINEFKVLTWPPNSPDFNRIEHLWIHGASSPIHGGPTAQLTGLWAVFLKPGTQGPPVQDVLDNSMLQYTWFKWMGHYLAL